MLVEFQATDPASGKESVPISSTSQPDHTAQTLKGDEDRPMSGIAILFLKLYQLTLSPLLGPRCRFAPNCSEYAIQAFRRYGAIKGGRLVLRRLMHCHPWGGSGYDPLP